MAVTSVELQQAGRGGSAEIQSGMKYTAVYRVTVDNINDGPAVVLYARNLPAMGSTYSVGKDHDNGAVAKTGSAARVRGSPYLWDVTVGWSSIEPGKRRDAYIHPVYTPAQMSITNQSREVPVEFAYYAGGYSYKPYKDGTLNVVASSAGEPFDPGLTKKVSDVLVRKSFNTFYFPTQDYSAIDHINSQPIVIRGPGYMSLRVARHAAYLDAINGTINYPDKGLPYWSVEYQISVRLGDSSGASAAARTWDDMVLDRGVKCIASPGDPDGLGGEVPELPPDKVFTRPFYDKDQRPITTPILMDGKGKALQQGKSPVFGTWQKYPHTNFSSLQMMRR